MAKIKAEYEVCDEFIVIAKKLQELYPDQFLTKPVDSLRSMLITNKERTDNSSLLSIKTIGMPMSLDVTYKFYIVMYSSDWNEFTEPQKSRVVSWALITLPDSDEDKLIQPDLKEHSTIIRTFGVDWIDSPSAPNPLDGNVNWNSERVRAVQ